MEIDTTIDIGKNMTELLEKLAVNIGTTADKIFPWYLNQQLIEGILFIIILLSLSIICLSVAYIFHKKSDYSKNYWQFTEYVALVSFIFGVLFCFSLAAGSTTAISQIFNPEYYAFKILTKDLSRLLGG